MQLANENYKTIDNKHLPRRRYDLLSILPEYWKDIDFTVDMHQYRRLATRFHGDFSPCNDLLLYYTVTSQNTMFNMYVKTNGMDYQSTPPDGFCSIHLLGQVFVF